MYLICIVGGGHDSGNSCNVDGLICSGTQTVRQIFRGAAQGLRPGSRREALSVVGVLFSPGSMKSVRVSIVDCPRKAAAAAAVPRDPLRSTGRPPDINLHQKSAPEINSKATSWWPRGQSIHDTNPYAYLRLTGWWAKRIDCVSRSGVSKMALGLGSSLRGRGRGAAQLRQESSSSEKAARF